MSGILAQFDTLGATKKAVERLMADGHSDLDVYSPFPAPELEEAMGIVASPVRRWALIGGITGFSTATALTGLTAVAQNHARMLLDWTDNSVTESGFVIQWRRGAGPIEAMISTTAGFVHRGLSEATEYSYRVGATNSGNGSFSGFSPWATATSGTKSQSCACSDL